ncbi:hypothetical protein G5V59_04000 [Nocardioides sp. W3-2-3]|uniref:hypothetical protein n=1 Tax=Nocardioides convexus TaxID=2712224 RepID=UPI002418B38D|nr:hypothetical protein [Nocardioides convexus]NGZ99784.1 hypothetical protein [Nocardioides convexus]
MVTDIVGKRTASLILDPPGGRKVAAYDALRKFPTLKKNLHLGGTDDLRRSFGEDGGAEGCGTDFGEIEKWAGERAALAVVPLDPTPVVVLQVSDDEPEAGLDRRHRISLDSRPPPAPSSPPGRRCRRRADSG